MGGSKVNNKVNKLQNILHELLNSYLNGGFSAKGYLFYPLTKDLSKENISRINNLKKIIENLNKDYDFIKSKRLLKDKIDNRNCAKLISSLYSDFEKIEKPKTKLINKKICKEFEIKDYNKNDINYLKPLFRLKGFGNKVLQNYSSGFYLHGSFATKDYVRGWSDVDTFLILKKGVVDDYKSLNRLRDLLYKSGVLFYKIDPLQHHGYMICTEYDLDYYNQTYLPVEVLKYANSFFEDHTDKIRIRESKIENRESLRFFVDYFNKKRAINGIYDKKFVFHLVTLFPTIYLQAKGKYVYKKFSFDLARGDFKEELWRVVDLVSEIRKNWRLPRISPITKLLFFNPTLAYQINAMLWDVTKIIENKDKRKAVEREILWGMRKLTDEAWRKIK